MSKLIYSAAAVFFSFCSCCILLMVIVLWLTGSAVGGVQSLADPEPTYTPDTRTNEQWCYDYLLWAGGHDRPHGGELEYWTGTARPAYMWEITSRRDYIDDLVEIAITQGDADTMLVLMDASDWLSNQSGVDYSGAEHLLTWYLGADAMHHQAQLRYDDALALYLPLDHYDAMENYGPTRAAIETMLDAIRARVATQVDVDSSISQAELLIYDAEIALLYSY